MGTDSEMTLAKSAERRKERSTQGEQGMVEWGIFRLEKLVVGGIGNSLSKSCTSCASMFFPQNLGDLGDLGERQSRGRRESRIRN